MKATVVYAQSMPSPLGTLWLLEYQGHLAQLYFEEDAPDLTLGSWQGKPVEVRTTSLLEKVMQQLGEYFAGKRQNFELPLAPVGTTFQQNAWKALQEIPYGATRSYSEQARSLGLPRAARAVGQANGRNPLPIIIPCHRVIAQDGSLGGYSCGLEKKTWLLDWERRHSPA